LPVVDLAETRATAAFYGIFANNQLFAPMELSITVNMARPLLLVAAVATRDRKPDG
jgi:hypothetical protein